MILIITLHQNHSLSTGMIRVYSHYLVQLDSYLNVIKIESDEIYKGNLILPFYHQHPESGLFRFIKYMP